MFSKTRVPQTRVHAGKAPALILILPDHTKIPDSIGTRRGREEDSAERGGREGERGTNKKRESQPCPDVAVASSEQQVTVQSLRKRDEAHPPTRIDLLSGSDALKKYSSTSSKVAPLHSNRLLFSPSSCFTSHQTCAAVNPRGLATFKGVSVCTELQQCLAVELLCSVGAQIHLQ